MATTAEWGVWHDPDTEQGVAAYASAGLELRTPDQVATLDDKALQQVTEDCGVLLQEIYRGTYPLPVGDAEALANSIRGGETHLFTLARDESLIAMAALVRAQNKVGGTVQFSELGRACGISAVGDQQLSLRPLLKYRVPWGQQNHPDTDFFYSSTRAAGTGYDGVPSGQGVQSVWWGGRRHSPSHPMVTTNVGWDYRLGRVEPFNGFVVPAHPYQWGGAVSEVPLYVPTERDKHTLDTLIYEGTSGRVHPHTVVVPGNESVDVGFTRVAAPSERVTGRYVVSHAVEATMTSADADAELTTGFSQKVVVEADVATTSEGARTMMQLQADGWTLVGWQPSEQVYGARCPVYARLNPTHLDQVLPPKQHAQYFEGSGLAQTRQLVDRAYAMMYAKAQAA